MRITRFAVPLLAASGAIAMPSKAGNEARTVEIRSADSGAVEEHHEKRFIWAIALAGQVFFRFVNDFLHFMEDPPHAWETESGNCASKSHPLT